MLEITSDLPACTSEWEREVHGELLDVLTWRKIRFKTCPLLCFFLYNASNTLTPNIKSFLFPRKHFQAIILKRSA